MNEVRLRDMEAQAKALSADPSWSINADSAFGSSMLTTGVVNSAYIPSTSYTATTLR